MVETETESEAKPPVYKGIPGIMCEKEGLLFKNARINGQPVEVSKCIYGEIEEAGDAWRMVFGNRKHHCTGKSREWNEAFEEFIGSGSFHENPVIWAVFGTDELEEYTFEIDIKCEEDNPLTLSAWNHHPETDAGCNEPKDTEWTTRTVRNQVWKLEKGRSATRVPRFFDKPLSEEEQVPVSIPYGEYNHYKMVCQPCGYECYINDRLVQKKTHVLHPLINALAVQDKEKIYLKMVNVDEEDREVRICTDCAVTQEVLAEVLAADPGAVNSFEDKEHVSAVCRRIPGGSEFTYRIPAHSVNVLVMEKEGRKSLC